MENLRNDVQALAQPEHTVRVWFANLNCRAEQLSAIMDTLGPDELERAQRFRFEEHRRRFIIAHGFLRQLLAYHLECDPKAVRFRYESRGKPVLAECSALHFSLSHTDDIAGVAIARGRRVGIDIEVMRADLDIEGIARHNFSRSEVKRISRAPGAQRRARFYEHWTAKEAYLKAQGHGLSAPLDSVELVIRNAKTAPRLRIRGTRNPIRWSLRLFRPFKKTVCAIAAEGSELRIELADWSPLEGHFSVRPFLDEPVGASVI